MQMAARNNLSADSSLRGTTGLGGARKWLQLNDVLR
jgi:hypothetical protein